MFSYRDDSEPNIYHIMKDNKWFCRIQMNGEMTSLRQYQYIILIIKCLNSKIIKAIFMR